MKMIRILHFTFLLLICSIAGLSQQLPQPILLWPGGAPGATGESDEDRPAITVFSPEPSKRNGTAMLVIPGGGFTIRATDHEGVLVSQWLRSRGITAFLLRYRLRPLYDREHWLRDGQRGMQFIRSNAEKFGIDNNRIGAVGFSAGANLAADLAFHPLQQNAQSPDNADHFSSKPDFIVLAYGSMQVPAGWDSAALSGLPPVFMYGTEEDAGITNGMVQLYANLSKARVPVEAHFFQNGEHGSGFAIGDPVLGKWPELMHTWLRSGGFLTAAPRFALSGIVKLDGSPLVRGMLILTPVGKPESPQVVVYITNTGTGELGRFSVPAKIGPVAGKYKVEVRQDATRWTSNSRDPFMIKMMAKQHDGSLKNDDIKQWGEYLRKRDLSPSIENQKVFLRKSPGDTADYIIDVTEGKEFLLEVFSKQN